MSLKGKGLRSATLPDCRHAYHHSHNNCDQLLPAGRRILASLNHKTACRKRLVVLNKYFFPSFAVFNGGASFHPEQKWLSMPLRSPAHPHPFVAVKKSTFNVQQILHLYHTSVFWWHCLGGGQVSQPIVESEPCVSGSWPVKFFLILLVAEMEV